MSRFQCAAATLLAVSLLAGCTGGSGGGRAIEGPVLAVVSYSPDEIVLVEPATLSVIERVRLRSMGTDPLALPERRMFVTAQCGGLGGDADDALALIDLEQGGRVRYVELPQPNPGFVARAGDGTVLVSHGVWNPDGIPVTRVDIGSGTVVGRERVANAYGALVMAAGWMWTAGPEGADVTAQTPTIRKTSLDLENTQSFPVEDPLPLLAPDGDSADTILTVSSSGGSATVSRVSAEDMGAITSVTLGDLREGIGQVLPVDDTLVLRDSSGAEMSRAGGPLIVLDRATLRELRRIETGASVASIAGLGGLVYAVTWNTGELLAMDPATGTIIRRVHIEGLDGKMLQLAAMDASRPSSGP